MKKTLLTIVFFVFVINVFSQSQIGFKAAFLHPNFKLTSTPSYSTETFDIYNAMSYSLDYKRRWPGLFNFGVGVEYHRKKSHFITDYRSVGADVHSDYNYQLDYLNFKLLPEFVYGEKLRAYFQIGPYLGFLVSSNGNGSRKLDDGNGSITIEEDERVLDYFPGIDWGLLLGAGAEYPITARVKLAIEIQYMRGFAGFAKEDQYIYATKNFSAGLSFIYVFKGYAERIKGEN